MGSVFSLPAFVGAACRLHAITCGMPSLGPSEQLLKQLRGDELTWAAFARAYRAELFMDGPIDDLNKTIKNHGQKFSLRLVKQLARSKHVTLLCHCDEDQQECHRHLLKDLLASSRI